jgi:hypothetical protein
MGVGRGLHAHLAGTVKDTPLVQSIPVMAAAAPDELEPTYVDVRKCIQGPMSRSWNTRQRRMSRRSAHGGKGREHGRCSSFKWT